MLGIITMGHKLLRVELSVSDRTSWSITEQLHTPLLLWFVQLSLTFK